MRIWWLPLLIPLIPIAALCSPKKGGIAFANNNPIDIGNATVDLQAPYPMIFQLAHKRAAIIDEKGVHLTHEVDFDGHRIATVDDVELSTSSHEKHMLFVTSITGLAGAFLGALLALAALPALFAKTFVMRRWIMRAERARQKREAEQGTLR